MELREYQKQALDKIIWSKNKGLEGNDLIVLPTGSGKSVVIAHLAKTLNEPILILQPTKEILEQNFEKLKRYVSEDEIGIYSASMQSKTVNFYTFATIQSIYKKPEFFKQFKLVIIDEAHLVNPKNLSGMFTTFLNKIGNPKVIGFTATPYRLDTSYFGWGTNEVRCTTTIKLINRMKGFFWQRILFNINVFDLIENDFLCPLEYIDFSIIEHEDIPVNTSQSDFDLKEFETMFSKKESEVLRAIEYGEKFSKSILVFCSSVRQAEHLSSLIQSEVITAKTSSKERERIIKGFKSGKVKVVFNVGVLTTGFDHPALDCIILVRPTRSIALYYQMVGRGLRKAEGKTSCKVIDLTSTVKNLGKVETIQLVKMDKWELISESGSWHGKELYRFTIRR